MTARSLERCAWSLQDTLGQSCEKGREANARRKKWDREGGAGGITKEFPPGAEPEGF